MEHILRNNRVINEIMSNDSSAVMVMSPSDGENLSFLSELSNRYRHTYWYNADYYPPTTFALDLAKKVFSDQKDTLRKLIQTQYCDCNFDSDIIVMNAILEHISGMQGDCLLVMDSLEKLPESFSLKLFELMIKNCPKNLKMIFISEKYINLDYNSFSPACPKFIDALSERPTFPMEEILSVLDEKQQAILYLLGKTQHLLRSFIHEEMPEAEDILAYIFARQRELVLCKGDDLYYLNPKINEYLCGSVSEQAMPMSFSELQKKIICYHIKTGEYNFALHHAIKSGDVEWADKSVLAYFDAAECNSQLLAMAKDTHNVIDNVIAENEYLGYQFYLAAVDHFRGVQAKAIRKLDLLLERTKKGYLRSNCLFLKIRCLKMQKKNKEALEIMRDMEHPVPKTPDEIGLIETGVCMLPSISLSADFEINLELVKHYDSILSIEENEKYYWYVKGRQALAESYFYLGNYKKATSIISKIKKYVPFYVIPHNLVSYFYFNGDIASAERTAKESLKYAIRYGIRRDIANIFIVLAKCSMFYNRQNEAIAYIDNAVACTDTDPYIKIYSIALRAFIYAQTGRQEYAKDISLIYLRHYETAMPKYAYFLYTAYSYCCWRQGDYDTALLYANKAISRVHNRSSFWLIDSGIATSILLMRDELKDKTIIHKILRAARKYGMETVMVDCWDCFESVVEFSENSETELEFLSYVKKLKEVKTAAVISNNEVRVKLMGTTAFYINNKEVVWKTKKSKELFYLYVVTGEGGVDRKKIIDTLWSDYVYESALNNLKTTNNILRNTLNNYKISYKLEYKNGKYILKLNVGTVDYKNFIELLGTAQRETVLSRKMKLMGKLMEKYNGGFATEIGNDVFAGKRAMLAQDMELSFLKFIHELMEEGELLEAKKFSTFLLTINSKKEYENMLEQIELNIGKHYENK